MQMKAKEKRKILLTHLCYYAAVIGLYGICGSALLAYTIVFFNALFTPGYMTPFVAFLLGIGGVAIFEIALMANRWAKKD